LLSGAIHRVSLRKKTFQPTQWGAPPSKSPDKSISLTQRKRPAGKFIEKRSLTYTMERFTGLVYRQKHFNLHSGSFYWVSV